MQVPAEPAGGGAGDAGVVLRGVAEEAAGRGVEADDAGVPLARHVQRELHHRRAGLRRVEDHVQVGADLVTHTQVGGLKITRRLVRTWQHTHKSEG